MKHKYYFHFYLFVIFTSSFSFSQTVIDDFTDGNYTSNQTWTGSTTEFSVITDATLPNGSASTDGSYLASNASQGDISLAFPSTETSEWRFSLGSPNFSPSGSNYVGVVLMANSSFSGDLINDNVTNNFQGYYLRIGDSGTDPIALYRKTGSGESKVGDFPNSPSFSTNALQNGLNIRVTRSSSGVFELFYSTGFQNNSIPNNSAGTLTNVAYTTSSYFGVFQNIGSTSTSRRVYIDNIELGVVIWDGSDSNEWNTASNWSSNSVPITSDNVQVPAGLSTYPTISSGSTISVNNIIVESGATLIALGTLSATVTYNRSLTNATQWYYMSSPVIGEIYNDAWVTANSIASGQNNNRGVSWYDNSAYDTDTDGAATADTETGYWRYLQATSSGTFDAGQGYGIITSSPKTISFTGTGIHTITQTKAITTDVSNFNLVGNPFTSFLNLGDFFVDNPITTVLAQTEAYFWNGSSYDTRTSLLHPTYEIAPGQGFFVEAAANANVTFDIEDTSHLADTAEGSDTFQKSSRPEIHLLISDGNSSRYSNIYYIEGTTTGLDNGYDGKLFGGVEESFALYSHLVSESEGKNYQLQSLPNSNYENMIIPIGVNANSGKEITFSAEALSLPADIKVYLEDRELNTFNRLDTANSNYKLTLSNDLNGIGRFYLHTTQSALNIDKNLSLQNISIYKRDNSTLNISGLQQGKASVSLFNILGKQIITSTFTSNGVKEISLPKLVKGVYIVQLKTDAGKLNKKIIIE